MGNSQKNNREKKGKSPETTARKKRPQPQGRKGASLELVDFSYRRLFIYCCGMSRGNPGDAGAGVVLKTPEGEEVGRYGLFLGKTTKHASEYRSVLLGLKQAKEFGALDITIMSDSDLLTRQLSGEMKIRAEHLKELYDTIRGEITEFNRFQIKQIPRPKNKDAELMANRAIDEKL